MTEQPNDTPSGLTAYQKSLCNAAGFRLPNRSDRPSPARFYAVACGESEWTDEERTTIAGDPRLQRYESQMRDAVRLATRRPATVPLQRAIASAPVKQEPRAAAKELYAAALASCRESDPIRFLSRDGGGDVLLFPPDENGHVTVRFFGVIPHPVGLMVGESPVDFVKPIDQYGYASVLAELIRPVLSGEAELQVRTE